MSKLKQIKDLKVGDPVFMVAGSSPVQEYNIKLISVDEIHTSSGHKTRIYSNDYTAFMFTAERYGKSTFYLDRVKALKEQRKHLDESLKRIYDSQKSFLDSLIEANEKIRACDIEIANELQKNN